VTADDSAPSAGGVSVRTEGASLTSARDRALEALRADDLAAQLAAKTPTLWGAEATPEASIRLGWLDAPRISRSLLPRLAELRRELANEGIDHIVLAGMGGSSLAPEVICNTAGAPLTVLDTTDPGQVRVAIEDRLDRTLVVVSSKSGGTVETDSHRRAYAAAFEAAGVQDVGRRFVAVTDPGSPLEKIARDSGFREVFLADPNVGGRYSALTAFGLVPSALAGMDVERLLAEADVLAETLAGNDNNPSLQLGAALGGAGVDGRDKVVLADAGSGIAGFGDWAEQLIAESTGKSGRGLLPVVVESPDAPGTAPAGDLHLVTLGSATGKPEQTTVSGPLGAQLLAWEYATAVAGRVLQIDPFNQPNVQESKDNTNKLLQESGDGPLPEGEPAFTDGPIAVYGDSALLGNSSTVPQALAALLGAVPSRGYLAVMAYLDRFADAQASEIRALLAARLAHPVTFGWGPRFLHSTGQYHKGGPQVGAFLQITGEAATDLEIPGRPYTFARLQRAQALGDLGALAQRGRPVLRLHLQDRNAGLRALLDAARSLPEG
jgi:glucose-6-phosphate isomerase